MEPALFEALTGIAGERAGVVTIAQLYDFGLTEVQIRHLRNRKIIVRMARGVYRLAGAPPSHEQRIVAAIASAGGRAVCSHTTAAELLRIDCPGDGRVHLSVPLARSVANPLATVHQSAVIRPDDVVVVDGLPVTSPARTLLDLGSVLPVGALERAVDDAFVKRLADPVVVGRQFRHFRGNGKGRAGSGHLKELLGAWTLDGRPESQAEARLVRALLRAGLAPPTLQYVVRDRRGRLVARVDAAWPDDLVALEYDSAAFHSDPKALAKDRRRYAELVTLGWRVLPASVLDLRDPTDLVRRLFRLGIRSAAAA